MLWTCFVLFIVYPLSFGPVCRLWLAAFGSPPAPSSAWDLLVAIYAPLIYLGNTFPPVADFFLWYLGLWGAS